MIGVKIRRSINIRYVTALYLSLILVLALLSRQKNIVGASLFLESVTLVGAYAFSDLAWTYFKRRTLYLPINSIISALVLAVLVVPLYGHRWLLLALPLLAVIAKHTLRFGRVRHLVNPAAFAVIVASVPYQSIVSWSLVSVTREYLWLFALAGLGLVWYLRRMPVLIAFYAVHFGLITADVLLGGASSDELLRSLRANFFDSTTIFFATVMLVEPVTSSFRTRWQGSIYGALVALLAWLAIHIHSLLDPLLVGLISGTLLAGLLFVPRKQRVIIKTKESV